MDNIKDFKKYYIETKNKINKKLEEFNDRLIDDENGLIKSNLELFSNLNSDGKIIRGTLVNLGYYLIKEDKDYSLDLSLAYEVFQTAILVHDDIIDNDNTRRGKTTIHYANYNKYKKYNDESKHLGESIAICIGDYGLYKSNQIIVDAYKDDKNLSKVISNFNNTVLTTIRGELIDVILPFNGRYNLIDTKNIEDNIMEIYRLKTAHYTIIGPMSVGILLAGGDNDKLKDIEDFGTKVGMAFQIQDDILGIYSDEMGKVKGTDIKEFKQTILYSHIINTEYKDELMKYYGNNDISEENILKVQELFKRSGSYDYSYNKMNQLYDDSLNSLNNISWIKEEKKNLLRGFVEYLRNRNK